MNCVAYSNTMEQTSPKDRYSCPAAELPLYYAECAKYPEMNVPDKMKYEIIRYSSFSGFQRNCPLSLMKLSRAGFYYDGNSDSVKCYQCNYAYIDIQSNDDPMEIHYRNSPNCNFVKGNYDSSHLATSVVREESHSPAVLRNAYSGQTGIPESNMNQRRHNLVANCASTQNQINDQGFIVEENRPSFSGINSTTQASGQNMCKSRPKITRKEIFEDLGIFIEKPKHPKYAILTNRLKSFNSEPKPGIVSGEKLAKAGFFYDGSEDQVYCFFCGGGRKDWEADDDPWIEHAHWFPSCSFVKQCKGSNFIQQVQEKEQGTGRLKEEHDNSAAIQSVIEMGFSEEEIRMVYEKSLYEGSHISADQLLELLWETKNMNNKHFEKDSNPESEQNKEIEDIETREKLDYRSQQGYEALVLEHQMLLEQSLCKVCMDDNATTVFLPCGHMCTCVDCAPAMVKCPICQTFVKGTVKAILS